MREIVESQTLKTATEAEPKWPTSVALVSRGR